MAQSPSKSSNVPFDQDMVVDQPGLALIFFGLCLSVLLGLLVRASFAPERMQGWVEGALSQLDDRVVFSASSANLVLSQRGLPRFALRLSEVQARAVQCVQDFQLDVDELELAINLRSLLRGRVEIREVRLQQTDLRLGDFLPCADRNTQGSPSEVLAAGNSDFAKPQNDLASKEAEASPWLLGDQSPLTRDLPDLRLSVAALTVSSPELGGRLLSLRQLRVQSEKQTRALIDTLIDFSHPLWLGPTASSGRLRAEVVPAQVKGTLRGAWREGQYELSFTQGVLEDLLQIRGQLQHIPLAEVTSALKANDILDHEIDLRSLWLSSRLESDIHLRRGLDIPLRLTDLRVEGDLGELSSHHVEVRLRPDRRPLTQVEASFKRVPVRELARSLGASPQLLSLISRGFLEGNAVIDEDVFSISVTGQDLALGLAPLGSREFAMIPRWRAHFDRSKDGDRLRIFDIDLSEGKMVGEVVAEASSETEGLILNVQLEHLDLPSPVGGALLRGGNSETIKGEFEMIYQDETLRLSRARLSSARVSLESLVLKDWSLDIQGHDENEYKLKGRASSGEIPLAHPDFDFLRDALGAPSVAGVMPFEGLELQAQGDPVGQIRWPLLRLDLPEQGARILAHGEWNVHGELSGEIKREGPEGASVYQVFGTRQNPQLSP